MNEVLTAISTVGFPIAMCLVVCYYVYTKDKAHGEEVSKLSEAVNKVTLSVQRLVDKIDILINERNDKNE